MERHYGHMPAADLPAEASATEPAQREERRRRFAKPVHADRLVAGYKVPGQEHPDWAVLDFLASILCGGPSARLYRRLVVDTELASSVDCGMQPFRDPGLFRLGVNMARGHRAEEALAEVDALMDTLTQEPVSEAQLTKIRFRSRPKRASAAARRWRITHESFCFANATARSLQMSMAYHEALA